MHAFRRDDHHRHANLWADVTVRRAVADRGSPRQSVDARETYIRIPSPSPPTPFFGDQFPPHGHLVREDRPEPSVRAVREDGPEPRVSLVREDLVKPCERGVREDRFEPRDRVVHGPRGPVVGDREREATGVRGRKRCGQSAAGPDAREKPTGFVQRLPGQPRLRHNEDATLIYFNPLAPEDIVDRKSLLMGDDIEDVLEDFARLRRLGRFADAVRLFEEQIAYCLDNRYIQIQYAQSLLEAGEIGRLTRLAQERTRISGDDPLELLWALLAHTAEVERMSTKVELQKFKAARAHLDRKWPRFDSTDMAIFCCLVKEEAFPHRSLAELWDHLVEADMVWESRDLVTSMVSRLDGFANMATQLDELKPADFTVAVEMSTGPEWNKATQTGPRLKTLYNWGHGPSLEALLHHIRRFEGGPVEELDDSTLSALLDSCTTIGLAFMATQGRDARAEECLRLSRRYADQLVARDESSVKTRPYLRWAVAKTLSQDPDGFRSRGTFSFSGTRADGVLVRTCGIFPAFGLPLYVPGKGADLRWTPARRSQQRPTGEQERAVETIRAVLRAAQDLGDVRLETGCLVELMHLGAKNGAEGAALTALIKTWTAAGDRTSVQLTHLFRQMVEHTGPGRERLRRDILASGMSGRHDALFVQYMVLRALAPTAHEARQYKLAARAEAERHKHRAEMLLRVSRSDRFRSHTRSRPGPASVDSDGNGGYYDDDDDDDYDDGDDSDGNDNDNHDHHDDRNYDCDYDDDHHHDGYHDHSLSVSDPDWSDGELTRYLDALHPRPRSRPNHTPQATNVPAPESRERAGLWQENLERAERRLELDRLRLELERLEREKLEREKLERLERTVEKMQRGRSRGRRERPASVRRLRGMSLALEWPRGLGDSAGEDSANPPGGADRQARSAGTTGEDVVSDGGLHGEGPDHLAPRDPENNV
ncbi:hypothetical protein MAPG_01378 [Magnaporthiopsis poae ATCC 64411]|uniref:Uncharacterized protein n=1 Tax=Magnaporthiopsis poae (strain ATCC 64411 / 73-15) TaxID=644358 RepID=A0A0C4DNJ1_MAGP6|nr:hypothetical protein MAPG_01378 [Magnaporthiopsis poae ATCC 64411]